MEEIGYEDRSKLSRFIVLYQTFNDYPKEAQELASAGMDPYLLNELVGKAVGPGRSSTKVR
jgi:hypothetical protein